MLEHLVEMLDENPYAAAVNSPVGSTVPAIPEYIPPTRLEELSQKLGAFNVDMPYTARDKRRIVENMTFTEALMAVKSSDRLTALNMLGKMESVNVFAAEKKVIEVNDTSVLKQRILERLGITPDQIEDATIVDVPQHLIGSSHE